MIKLRIREIIKQRGITQAELARRLGVTPITVNGWATGRRLPSLEVLDRIAEITSTPITQFFAAERRPHSFPEASNKQQPIINQLIRNTLMKKLLLLLLMVVTTAVGSWAQTADETPLYTCLFGSDYNERGTQNYTSTWTATNAGFKWTIVNFNNNQNQWKDQIKCGSKSNASIATITTQTAISEVIDKVTIKIDAITAAKVNSISLVTSKTNNFDASNYIETKTFTKGTGEQSVILDKPEASLYYRLIFDCQKGSSNGLVTLSAVKYYEKKEVDKSQPATKIDFSLDENVKYTEVQTLALSTDGRDKDGNMLPIHYLISNDDTADETSPVYTEPIIVDKSMTVSAWVAEGVEDIKAYTVEIPVVVPGDPVVKVNDEVINPESELPYGTEVTIWSENATKLADEELVEYANPYTFTLTEDYLNTFMGVNGNETSENVLDVILTLARPELSATIGDVVVENGGVYHVFPGMEVALEYKNADASSIAVLDAEGEHVAVVDDKFAINAATTYMVSVSAGSNNHADIEFTTEFVDVKLEKATATFDFTVEGAYGLTPYGQHPYSGLPNTQNNYETKISEIKDVESGVAVSFGKTEGNGYRQWCSETGSKEQYTTSFDLRLLKGAYMNVSAPEGCIIFNIKATGSKLQFDEIANNGNGTNADFEIKAENVKFSATETKTFKTMTVEYGRIVAANPEKPVVDFDATSNIFKVTVKPGHHVWYRSYSYVPQNKARVAQGAENAEWEKLTESGDVKAEVPATESGVLHRYEFLSHNPVTKLQSDAVRYSVKADGSLSGVEDVEVESGVEAEYFNLQGVRVAAPLAPGLYIEHRGDKAVKVRIN